MSKQLVIVHARRIIRESLRALLEANGGHEVVGEAADGRAAIETVERTRPAMVLMDLSLPVLNGIDATRQLARKCPRAKVLVLAMNSDRHHVAEALKAGAAGALWHDCSSDELLRAIEVVQTEQMYLSPDIADVVVNSYVRNPEGNGDGRLALLTNRQREVLQLLSEGRSTKQIALDLDISPKTVDTHRQDLMTKLNLFNVAELTKFAVREGLTSLDA